jgi:hypothetical protein
MLGSSNKGGHDTTSERNNCPQLSISKTHCEEAWKPSTSKSQIGSPSNS